MANRERVIVALVVLFGGLMLTGCATVQKVQAPPAQAPPELVKAIETGNLSNVKSIIEENPKLVNSQHDWKLRFDFEDGYFTNFNPEGVSPLYVAVWYNNKDMVKLLLENGADVDSLWEGTTLLKWLMCTWHYVNRRSGLVKKLPHAEDMAMLLINSGADVKKTCKNCYTPLHCAAESGWFDLAEMLIDKGANANAKFISKGRRRTPLLAAARSHQIEIVKLLIKKGAEVNFKGDVGTALHLAARDGWYDLAKLLIDRGARLDVKGTEGGHTPLHLAANGGHFDIVKLLIEKGANINSKTDKNLTSFIPGGTPLQFALLQSRKNIAELLINNGANVKIAEKNGSTPLHLVVGRKEWFDISKLLIDKGVAVNSKDKKGKTPLMRAASNKNPDIAQLLIEKGAHVNVKDEDGKTPLHYAASSWGENADVVKMLLEKGAEVNAKNDIGSTPLHYAAWKGYTGAAELLIKKGAEVNAKNEYGITPLRYAVGWGHKETAALLLKHGSIMGSEILDAIAQGNIGEVKSLIEKCPELVNPTEDEGKWTPLFWAVKADQKDIAEFLINKGAEINIKANKDGFTPLHIATKDGHKNIIELLVSKGADINVKNNKGQTPLNYLIKREWSNRNISQPIVKLLIDRGANINTQDEEGKTPLHWAENKEHVELLIEKGAYVNLKDQKGNTPLHAAVGLWIKRGDIGHGRKGSHQLRKVELLILHGVDINALNKDYKTALDLARNKEVVDLLRKHGAVE